MIHTIRSSCSPLCPYPTGAAFRVVNSGSIPRKKWFLGPFFGFDLAFFHSKTSSFLAF